MDGGLEVGHRIEVDRAANRARVESLFATFPDASFSAHLVTVDGPYVTMAWSLTASAPDGSVATVARSSIEIFKVVGGLIVETWNAAQSDGVWA